MFRLFEPVSVAEIADMLLRTSQIQHLKQYARTLHYSSALNFFKREPTETKRARMLKKFIANSSEKKHWHLQLGATGAPDQSIYDKVPRPHKRAGVLNSLFMKNITDVLSTGDVCPEIMGYGVEITGVRVTNDYQIVNVYWQIADVEETCNTDVEMILAKKASAIRGELIRRNVLGKVPRIYFIRDPTNKRAADFQRCLDLSGASEIKNPPTLCADDLLKNLFKFPVAQDQSPKENAVEEPEKPETKVADPASMPERPPDMKLDIMGLDHEKMFNKVLAARKKVKEAPLVSSSVVHPAAADDDDGVRNRNIVYSIPASPLLDDTDREKQMKKFCIERKLQWLKMSKHYNEEAGFGDSVSVDASSDIVDDENFEEDYFEEEFEDTDDRCP